jgi:hypothetical protein
LDNESFDAEWSVWADRQVAEGDQGRLSETILWKVYISYESRLSHEEAATDSTMKIKYL